MNEDQRRQETFQKILPNNLILQRRINLWRLGELSQKILQGPEQHGCGGFTYGKMTMGLKILLHHLQRENEKQVWKVTEVCLACTSKNTNGKSKSAFAAISLCTHQPSHPSAFAPISLRSHQPSLPQGIQLFSESQGHSGLNLGPHEPGSPINPFLWSIPLRMSALWRQGLCFAKTVALVGAQ